MSLSIYQQYITDLDDFTWGKGWRATTIIKERRVNADYYFANITRYYGNKDETDDYDLAETMEDTAWLGRNEKFVGKRGWDEDHDSPTHGKRIYNKAITEVITEKDSKGKPRKREVLIEGKVVYEYTIPVNEKNTAKMKELAGATGLNQQTQFLFVYGASPPHTVNPKTFWSTSVSDYLESIDPLNAKNQEKNNGKKI